MAVGVALQCEGKVKTRSDLNEDEAELRRSRRTTGFVQDRGQRLRTPVPKAQLILVELSATYCLLLHIAIDDILETECHS
jgi:hypothetical protein